MHRSTSTSVHDNIQSIPALLQVQHILLGGATLQNSWGSSAADDVFLSHNIYISPTDFTSSISSSNSASGMADTQGWTARNPTFHRNVWQPDRSWPVPQCHYGYSKRDWWVNKAFEWYELVALIISKENTNIVLCLIFILEWTLQTFLAATKQVV